mmetsp:Transcript_5219/g.10960  ORF Transcript_5219/g.10960 Transcript_5219/m.10960 type:complete len:462 (-) Transcript_5219:55-1440(-)
MGAWVRAFVLLLQDEANRVGSGGSSVRQGAFFFPFLLCFVSTTRKNRGCVRVCVDCLRVLCVLIRVVGCILAPSDVYVVLWRGVVRCRRPLRNAALRFSDGEFCFAATSDWFERTESKHREQLTIQRTKTKLTPLPTVGNRAVVPVVAIGGPPVAGLGGRVGKIVVLDDAFQHPRVVLVEGRLGLVGRAEHHAGGDPQGRRPQRQELEPLDGRLDVALVEKLVPLHLGLRFGLEVSVVPAGFLVFDDLRPEAGTDVAPAAVDPDQEGDLEAEGSHVGGGDFLKEVSVLRKGGTGDRVAYGGKDDGVDDPEADQQSPEADLVASPSEERRLLHVEVFVDGALALGDDLRAEAVEGIVAGRLLVRGRQRGGLFRRRGKETAHGSRGCGFCEEAARCPAARQEQGDHQDRPRGKRGRDHRRFSSRGGGCFRAIETEINRTGCNDRPTDRLRQRKCLGYGSETIL